MVLNYVFFDLKKKTKKHYICILKLITNLADDLRVTCEGNSAQTQCKSQTAGEVSKTNQYVVNHDIITLL